MTPNTEFPNTSFVSYCLLLVYIITYLMHVYLPDIIARTPRPTPTGGLALPGHMWHFAWKLILMYYGPPFPLCPLATIPPARPLWPQYTLGPIGYQTPTCPNRAMPQGPCHRPHHTPIQTSNLCTYKIILGIQASKYKNIYNIENCEWAFPSSFIINIAWVTPRIFIFRGLR